MSEDEDELQMDFSSDQSGADGGDLMGFGPLLPTESERSLMDRVRQELKIELKQVNSCCRPCTLAYKFCGMIFRCSFYRDLSRESKT